MQRSGGLSSASFTRRVISGAIADARMMATILKVVVRITQAFKHEKLALHTCQILKTCSVEARDESSSTSSECKEAIAVVCFNWFIEVMLDRINEVKRSKNGFLFEAGRFLTGRWRWCGLASDASWEDRVGVRKPRVCGCPASEGSLGRFDASSRMRMYDVEAGRYHVTHPMFFLWNRFGCLATIFLLIAIQFNFWFWLFHNQVLTNFLLQKVRSHYLFRIFGRASRAFDTYLSVGLVCSMSLRSSKMPIPIHVSCIMMPSPCTRS